jgi:CubicO group peptidase (beta-lactamase class C family)
MRAVRHSLALLCGIALCAAAQTAIAAAPANLGGVWMAQRRFGPEIRGTLTIEQRADGWTAEIAGHGAVVGVEKNRIHFELAGNRGSFRGEVKGETIEGFWVQPNGVVLGSPFASPVTLTRVGSRTWRGEVMPREDMSTLYLVVTPQADGSLAAFLRNPDRNIGVFMDVQRLVVNKTTVELHGHRMGATEDVVLARGSYDPEGDTLSIYIPSRGGSFDFQRIDDDPESGFYPRAKKPAPYVYRPPRSREDGWPTGTLDEVGMSRERISAFMQMLTDMPDDSVHASNIHGVLLARHGKLVLEEYFHGYSADEPHDTRSAAKSLTSVLVGNAITEHAPMALTTPVYEVMEDGKLPADLDPRKRAMTVENLLTMTAGFYCDDRDPKAPGNEDVMQEQTDQPDWYRYTLAVPMAYEPGRTAVYCSSEPNLVGGVLARRTGTWLPEYFRDHVAMPLQMTRYYLPIMPNGEAYMGGGAHLLPRDFMKLGQMMLDGGVWHGRRIVSADWAQRSSEPHYELRGIHYGYLWWVVDLPYGDGTVRAFFAGGNGGQVVMVIPKLDLVFACYGGNYSDQVLYVPQRVYVPKYILPAVTAGH